MIESGDLVNLGLGQLHLFGQRGQVVNRQMAEAVLQLVQVLNQQVALARRRSQHLAHRGARLRGRPAALRALTLSLAQLLRRGNRNHSGFHADFNALVLEMKGRSRVAPAVGLT